jgi:hypothetical protein
MDYRLESEIWITAKRSIPERAFFELIADAVGSYRRTPRYSAPERMYASDIGPYGVYAPGMAASGAAMSFWQKADPYVLVRAQLREHIYRVLQQHLLSSSLASDAIIDNQMAGDLGL